MRVARGRGDGATSRIRGIPLEQLDHVHRRGGREANLNANQELATPRRDADFERTLTFARFRLFFRRHIPFPPFTRHCPIHLIGDLSMSNGIRLDAVEARKQFSDCRNFTRANFDATFRIFIVC